jgi:hypothetical protein
MRTLLLRGGALGIEAAKLKLNIKPEQSTRALPESQQDELTH